MPRRPLPIRLPSDDDALAIVRAAPLLWSRSERKHRQGVRILEQDVNPEQEPAIAWPEKLPMGDPPKLAKGVKPADDPPDWLVRVEAVRLIHTQTRQLSENSQLLTVLSRRSKRYHVLRELHQPTERAHRHHRDRYDTSGKDVHQRQKNRRCLPSNQLRANAAGILEWYRINLRHGWIGNHPTQNRNHAVAAGDGGRHSVFMRSREQHGTDLPYGPKAIELGLAWAEPPAGYVGWEERERDRKLAKKGEKRNLSRRGKKIRLDNKRLTETPHGLVDDNGELVFARLEGADPPDDS